MEADRISTDASDFQNSFHAIDLPLGASAMDEGGDSGGTRIIEPSIRCCACQLRAVLRAICQFIAIGMVLLIVLYEAYFGAVDTRNNASDIAMLLAAGTVIMASYEIIQHLRHYSDPELQSRIIRMLWLPPIYSVASCIGLRGQVFGNANVPVFATAVVNVYEAYTIYTFLTYLMLLLERAGKQHKADGAVDASGPADNPSRGTSTGSSSVSSTSALRQGGLESSGGSNKYLPDPISAFYDSASSGSDWSFKSDDTAEILSKPLGDIVIRKNAAQLLQTEPDKDCPWMVCPCILFFRHNKSCQPWKNGAKLLYNVRLGVLQYVVVAVLLPVLVVPLELAGWYHAGQTDGMWHYGWMYDLIITGCSQLYAIHCLLYFYQATYFALKGERPFLIFAAVKFAVFASWWQLVALTVLQNYNILPWSAQWQEWGEEGVAADTATSQGENIAANMVQDMLICAEMFVLSLGHQWIFSYRPYTHASPRRDFVRAALHSSNMREVAIEVRATAGGLCGCCADGHEKPRSASPPRKSLT
jgi:hypothetical protein